MFKKSEIFFKNLKIVRKNLKFDNLKKIIKKKIENYI